VNVACVIPARGGSKRLPRKNLRPVGGKPLLAHSIGHARAAATVTRTIVSTDDPEIAAVARDYGAEVVTRPPELAADTCTSESALVHALDTLADTDGFVPDLVVFLQCTSPVRRIDDIDRAVETLLKDAADSVFSATESAWLIWRRDGRDLRSLTYDYQRRTRDQDHPEEYRENGSIYVFKPWLLRRSGNRLGGKIAVYPMDYWSSFQVDSEEDLALIDWILRRQAMAVPAAVPSPPALIVFDFDGVMTDNRVLVLEDGREAVACHRGDGWGIQSLRRHGVPVLVLSTERNAVVAARCAKLGIECVHGVGDKGAVLRALLRERGIDPARVVYVGNDVNDLECLQQVGCGMVVADAHPDVRPFAKMVLSRPGGEGAVREACDLVVAALTGLPAGA